MDQRLGSQGCSLSDLTLVDLLTSAYMTYLSPVTQACNDLSDDSDMPVIQERSCQRQAVGNEPDASLTSMRSERLQ